MGSFDLDQHTSTRHLKVDPSANAGAFATRKEAGVYSGTNSVVTSGVGVGITGATHIMATPESVRFSFLFVPNPAAIVPALPAYIMAGPPVQGVAYMAIELGMFAALTAGVVAITASLGAV